MTEAQLVDVIVEAAQLYGWMVSHFRPARTASGWRTALQGNQGLPDLVLARNGVVWLREVKVGRNKLRPDQERWRDAIGSDHWALWTDQDLPLILEELKYGVPSKARSGRPNASGDRASRSQPE